MVGFSVLVVGCHVADRWRLACCVAAGWLCTDTFVCSSKPNRLYARMGFNVCLFVILSFLLIVCLFVLGFFRFMNCTFPVGIFLSFIAYVVDPCPVFPGLLQSFFPGLSFHHPVFAFLPVLAPCTSLTLTGAVECVFAPATLS